MYPVLAAVGLLAGMLNVLAGGGSLLTLPVMVIMGLDGATANGTNRVAILAQNVVAVGGFRHRGWQHWRLSTSLALATLPGCLIGAWAGTRLSGPWFTLLLAGIMTVILLRSLFARPKAKTDAAPDSEDDSAAAAEHPAQRTARHPLAAHLAMVGVGFYGGFIQAGVGFILMAALGLALGSSLVHVNMHKVFIVAIYTALALAIFALNGQVAWGIGACLAVGNATGGWLGSQISVGGGEVWIRRVFNAALLVLVVKLVIDGVGAATGS